MKTARIVFIPHPDDPGQYVAQLVDEQGGVLYSVAYRPFSPRHVSDIRRLLLWQAAAMGYQVRRDT